MIYPDYVLNHQLPLIIFKKALKEYRKGTDLLELENYVGAIDKFDIATTIDPKFADVYSDWGVALLNWGIDTIDQLKLEKAIDKFKKCIDESHDHIVANYNWGFTLIELGRYDEAIEKFEQCIKTDNQYIDALFKWGYALLELRRYDEAIEKFEQCTDIDDEYIDAHHNIAHILDKQGKYKLANEEWKKIYLICENRKGDAKDLEDADFFSSFGGLLCCVFDEMKQSEEVYKEGLTFAPDDVDILLGIFHLYIVRSEKDSEFYWKAIEKYKKVEKILLKLPENIDNLLKLGDLYQEMEEYEKAENVLLKAIKKDMKNNEKILAALGYIYLCKENFDNAFKYLKEAEKRCPDDLDIKSYIADVYLNKKLIEKAQVEFNNILKVNPYHIEALIGLGEIYITKGENSDDEDMYNKAINYLTKAIEIARSENIHNKHKIEKEKELAHIFYFRGYARTKINDLGGAKKDFVSCLEYDQDYHNAICNKEKIEKFLNPLSHQMLMEKTGPWIILISSIFVLIANQFIFFGQFFGLPRYIEINYYALITFGSMIFAIIGIYLPQILKLKVPGIEIEKGVISQNPIYKKPDIKK